MNKIIPYIPIIGFIIILCNINEDYGLDMYQNTSHYFSSMTLQAFSFGIIFYIVLV